MMTFLFWETCIKPPRFRCARRNHRVGYTVSILCWVPKSHVCSRVATTARGENELSGERSRFFMKASRNDELLLPQLPHCLKRCFLEDDALGVVRCCFCLLFIDVSSFEVDIACLPLLPTLFYFCCCHVKGFDTITEYRKGLKGILVSCGS